MASITRSGTCVPPGPSKNTAGLPSIVCAREGNWERTQVRSRVVSDSVVNMGFNGCLFSAEVSVKCVRARTSSQFSVLSSQLPSGLRMLPHHGCVLRLDLVHHAHFIGLSIRIFIDAKVFFGQLINVGVSAFFGDFDYSAADFEIAIRIIGINNRQSYAGIAANVAIFLPSFGGIENDEVSVEVAPY